MWDWIANASANMAGTLVAAGVAYYLGTRFALGRVDDWRAARAVQCALTEWPPPNGVAVTLKNQSSQAISESCYAYWYAKGQRYRFYLSLPDGGAPSYLDDILPGDAVSGNAQVTGPYEAVFVEFTMVGTGRRFRKEVYPGRSLRQVRRKRRSIRAWVSRRRMLRSAARAPVTGAVQES